MKKQLTERLQELAGIKPLNEQDFDDKMQAAGDFSDDNLEPIKKGKMVHLNEYFEDIGKMKVGDTTIDVGYAKMDLVPREK